MEGILRISGSLPEITAMKKSLLKGTTITFTVTISSPSLAAATDSADVALIA